MEFAAMGLPEPEQCVPLRLVRNAGGETPASRQHYKVDVTNLPDCAGAYVVRFHSHEVQRLRGASPVIKIGETKSLWQRFLTGYNHQIDLTTTAWRLADALDRRQTLLTNAYLMYLLPRLLKTDEIVIHIYAQGAAKKERWNKQRELLRQHLDDHWELPPLNLDMKKEVLIGPDEW